MSNTIRTRDPIGLRIAQLRQNAGLSQSSLARLLSISPQAVQKWESRKGLPSVKTLRRVADVFNTSLLEIAKDTEFEDVVSAVMEAFGNEQDGTFVKPLVMQCSDLTARDHIAMRLLQGAAQTFHSSGEQWSEQFILDATELAQKAFCMADAFLLARAWRPT